jgi:hypothetical protein
MDILAGASKEECIKIYVVIGQDVHGQRKQPSSQGKLL